MKKLLFVLMISLVLSACGSKSKTTKRSSLKKKENTSLSLNEKSEKTKDISVNEIKDTKTFIVEENQWFTGIPNEQLEASITTEQKDGKKKVTFTNFKEVTLKEDKTTTEDETNFVIDTRTKIRDLQENESLELESKDSNESERSSFVKIDRYLGFWVILAIVIVYLIISTTKKTFNPLKWVI